LKKSLIPKATETLSVQRKKSPFANKLWLLKTPHRTALILPLSSRRHQLKPPETAETPETKLQKPLLNLKKLPLNLRKTLKLKKTPSLKQLQVLPSQKLRR
jgi:hypothetical protein